MRHLFGGLAIVALLAIWGHFGGMFSGTGHAVMLAVLVLLTWGLSRRP